MRRKQLAKRIAIAVLSAATVMSAAPVGVLAAETTSIEASDTAIKSTDEVTVTRSYVSDDDKESDDLSETIQNLLAAHTKTTNAGTEGAKDVETSVDGINVTYNGTSSLSAEDKTAIENRLHCTDNSSHTAPVSPATDSDYVAELAGATVEDFTFTDEDHYTFKVKTTSNGVYTVTVAIENATDTALTDAIAKLPSSYPSVASTGSTHNVAQLEKKILADLKDAGYNGDSSFAASPNVAAAINATRNGIFSGKINGQPVTVDLTYSSDQKSNDTNTSLTSNAFRGGTQGATTTNDMHVTASPKSTSEEKLSSVTDVDGTKVYTFSASTKLAQAVQAKDATKAVTKEEAVTNLKKYITDQLTTDKVADNGVSVDVKAVNIATAGTTDNKKWTVADGNTNGSFTFLVTTSIANDYAEWPKNEGAADEKANTEVNYVLRVTTGKTKTVKATGISLADKTVNLTGDKNVITTKAAAATDGKAAVEEATSPATLVTLKAALTPADANTAVTYTVSDKDGVDVTDKFKPVETAGEVGAVYKNGKSGDIVKQDADSLTLVFKTGDEGTYTITATSNGKTAKATLTVNTKFKDVSSNGYYKNAVDWAYRNGVTSGVSDTAFGVNENVTRAQFVTWLYREAVKADASNEIKDDDVKQVFDDVATTAYYAKAVQWASENNIADGTGAGKFTPNADVTRAQAITFIYRALGNPDTGAVGANDENTTNFTDVKAGTYYLPAVTWGVNHTGVDGDRIISGVSTTSFAPNQTATRAQGITFIYRAFGSALQ